ncbi:MAG: alanine dehydrogenase [Bacteroidetes bacterium]|nr:MAG: alanine dehydrogenase [Bacteroidota bacterium]
MHLLSVSVFGTSTKEDEKRVPIHPSHLEWIDKEIRKKLTFENGYGEPFGLSDNELSKWVSLAPREELFHCSDIILLPKPGQKDIDAIPEGGILWGWAHCVQQFEITQSAIDRKLTFITWEGMHRWSEHGDWQMHIFNKNNEIAGYAATLQAFSLVGINGTYGRPMKAIVLSFGSVSRGAIHALQGLGINDITIFTQRYSTLVTDQIAGINYRHFEANKSGQLLAFSEDGHSTCPFIEALSEADVLVNGILQDTNQPLMFVRQNEINKLKNGCLIIDVSCDEGMGFEFAKPTSFKNPMFSVGKINYYAVDHTPSYLWNSASWEISNSLLPYLPLVMEGRDRWKKSKTLDHAIEIWDGVVLNANVLSFQNRKSEYPHEVISS